MFSWGLVTGKCANGVEGEAYFLFKAKKQELTNEIFLLRFLKQRAGKRHVRIRVYF